MIAIKHLHGSCFGGIKLHMNKHVMTSLCILWSFVIFTRSYAEIYYVDSILGNDETSGLSEDAPWKTIQKVNSVKFNPGDSILFKRGRVWREQLIPNSGDVNGYIIYGAYGTGEKPRLLGSVQKNSASNWVNETANIWMTVPPSTGNEVGEELLSNPSFDMNTDGWSLWHEGGAEVIGSRDMIDYDSAPASYKIECSASGDYGHHIQLFTKNIAVESGSWYKLTFRAKSSQEFKMGSVSLARDTYPWTSYAADIHTDDLTIATDWRTYVFLFKVNMTDANARITFYLGAALPTGAIFHIDTFCFKRFENDDPIMVDVGNLIFNNEASCGVKVWQDEQLNEQGEYFYNENAHVLKIYSTSNPADYY